uniref:Uncharacterized protein n=1 Tax=Siphoviridae sp. ctvI513 TaxID=2827965 RepID=A0A8S5TJW1_9CAUD|nr:MAG TPA: hypothetical protein [Siphoviridae sp. ctvI513]
MGGVLTSHGGHFDDPMGDKKTSHGGRKLLTRPPNCDILLLG